MKCWNLCVAVILQIFCQKISRVKELMPDAFIGVDVIVGTRGETDGCFEEAFGFIRWMWASCMCSVIRSARNDGSENRTFRFARGETSGAANGYWVVRCKMGGILSALHRTGRGLLEKSRTGRSYAWLCQLYPGGITVEKGIWTIRLSVYVWEILMQAGRLFLRATYYNNRERTDMDKVAVVILNWNGEEMLRAFAWCVGSYIGRGICGRQCFLRISRWSFFR